MASEGHHHRVRPSWCCSRRAAAAVGSSAGSAGARRRIIDFRVSIAYSACMRAHGVPNFPDPDSSGSLPKADRAPARGQQLPVAGRPAKPASTCSRPRRGDQCGIDPAVLHGRRLSPSPRAAGADRGAEVRRSACARAGCRTGPTRSSIPRGVRCSRSASARTASTRTRRDLGQGQRVLAPDAQTCPRHRFRSRHDDGSAQRHRTGASTR